MCVCVIQAKSSTMVSAPIHSRDVWGLGQLIIPVVEEVGLESKPDVIFPSPSKKNFSSGLQD